MTIEEMKSILQDGVLTLELNRECPNHLYEFATFCYTNGNLFIDGEIEGVGFEESTIGNTLILSTLNKRLEITSNRIIYKEDGNSKEFVYGNDDRFTEADRVITCLMSESTTTIELNGQPVIARFDKYGLHIYDGIDYKSYLQLISLGNPHKIQYKDLLLLKPNEIWVAKIYEK